MIKWHVHLLPAMFESQCRHDQNKNKESEMKDETKDFVADKDNSQGINDGKDKVNPRKNT